MSLQLNTYRFAVLRPSTVYTEGKDLISFYVLYSIMITHWGVISMSCQKDYQWPAIWLAPVPLFFIQGGISVSTFQRAQPKWHMICVLPDPSALLLRRRKILYCAIWDCVLTKPQYKIPSKEFLSFLMGKPVFQDPPKMWFFTINKASSLLCHCSSVYFQTIQQMLKEFVVERRDEETVSGCHFTAKLQLPCFLREP